MPLWIRIGHSTFVALLLATACASPRAVDTPAGAPQASTVPSTPAQPPARSAFDACKLLTVADVAAIAPPTGPASAQNDATGSTCVYPYGRVGGISLWVGTAVYGYQMPSAYDQVKAENRAASPTDVSGVGDAAFYVSGLGELWFKKSGTLFQLKGLGVPTPWTVDSAKGLALKVLSHL